MLLGSVYPGRWSQRPGQGKLEGLAKEQSQDGKTGVLSSFFPDSALPVVVYMYILDTFPWTDFTVSQIEVGLYFCEFIKFSFHEQMFLPLLLLHLEEGLAYL